MIRILNESVPASDFYNYISACRVCPLPTHLDMFNKASAVRIKTISFDGNGTLRDFDKVMRHSLKHVLAELNNHITAGQSAQMSVEKMIQIRDEVAQEYKGQIINLENNRYKVFQRTLGYIGVKNDELAHELNEMYLKHRFEDIDLYEDVVPVLDTLAGRHKIGLLSNGNSYPDRCGLKGYFNFVVFSQDHGIEKPDRRIFEIALERSACNPDELLYIGDSLETDIKGAKDCGIMSVWLNHEYVSNEESIVPDYEITLLQDVSAILNNR